eukprot:Gb_25623 [translate_table: standard]
MGPPCNSPYTLQARTKSKSWTCEHAQGRTKRVAWFQRKYEEPPEELLDELKEHTGQKIKMLLRLCKIFKIDIGGEKSDLSVEEELGLQHEEIQRRLLTTTHVGLCWEVAATQDELHKLNQIVENVHADKEHHTRELLEKSMRMEEDLHRLRLSSLRCPTFSSQIYSQLMKPHKDFHQVGDEHTNGSITNQDVKENRADGH